VPVELLYVVFLVEDCGHVLLATASQAVHFAAVTAAAAAAAAANRVNLNTSIVI
jgi:hypothetical protein